MAVTIQSRGMVIRNLLDTGTSGGVTDAPIDGFTYARRDGVWVDITNEIAGNNIYIQETQPADTGDYLWIQTNTDGSGDYSVWFTDPSC